ncbi:MAG TPA: phenylacetic acid degradation b [Cyclobacteriaceae bacterium]|nr:phenylacetic acid degradation b [Cyclobacteriaceae bacterium]HMV08802.1 phenylacetic acid degradation b [Cyclobacteriaceae bacterium]HMV90538.1 phenylacetic acid degradation b [Cyclobacteriaceae bacterium]HMW99948.1 phenylacetic acid degradation b [Cyclobacteriaceae bacterium]HMX49189.1 phenylacetic acid degradation b [Cyclobacteriaceae bacterium]
MNSLDPRVNRLPVVGKPGEISPKAPLDQLGTFEVFVQPKEGKPFQHEGIVHAPDVEMAFVLAKEAFTRRFMCVSLYVCDTRNVYVSPLTEATANAYDLISDTVEKTGGKTSFEIYHLPKRGKQHVHAGTVQAGSPQEAMAEAKRMFKNDKTVYNIWAVRTSDIRFTSAEEKDLWLTLSEKKFRDASDYKGGDKLKEFLERNNA